jgi:hypothetical protein
MGKDGEMAKARIIPSKCNTPVDKAEVEAD